MSNDEDMAEREQRARAIVSKEPTYNKPSPRKGVFVLLLGAIVGCITLGIAVILSQPAMPAPKATSQSAPTQSTDGTSYGTGAATPTPLPRGTQGSTAATPTPAPGATPCALNCTTTYGAAESTQTATSAYQAAVNSATGTSGAPNTYGVGAPSGAPPSGAAPIARTVQIVDVTNGASAPVGGGAPADPNGLLAMRQRLLAESAAAAGGGAPVPAVAATPAPQTASGGDGAIGTPIIPPEKYEVPMGTCVRAALKGNLDSSLAGPVIAIITQTARDPRNGADIIPASSLAIGHYVGLTKDGDHLGIMWDYMRYPDLSKRPLTLAVQTTGTQGESGLSGRVDTHLVRQFRNTFIGSIVGAAGNILASALSRAPQVQVGTQQPTASAPGQQALPALYVNKTTPFCLELGADYDATAPYGAHS